MAKHAWQPGATVPNGRITVYAAPRAGMAYTIGLDFALGIIGKDFDAAVLLDANGEQAATAVGHWGETFYDVLQPILDAYGNPFIVPEWTAHGAAAARKLYDTGRWVYFDRDAKGRGNSARDQLGHVPTQWDITIQWLRDAIAAGKGPLIRDADLHSQLCRFGFRPKSAALSVDPDAVMDGGLTWGAPTGEHDDLVRACALAWAGKQWLPQFVAPKPKLPGDSIGKLLRYDKEDEPERPGSYWR